MKLKYRNVPTVVDGKRFASKREARRYAELDLMWKAGEIASLSCQPRFKIAVNDEPICTYVGDFEYWDGIKTVVEDVKGVKTDAYRIKKKLMKAVYGIEIQEV